MAIVRISDRNSTFRDCSLNVSRQKLEITKRNALLCAAEVQNLTRHGGLCVTVLLKYRSEGKRND
jgi:hypothetical protein